MRLGHTKPGSAGKRRLSRPTFGCTHGDEGESVRLPACNLLSLGAAMAAGVPDASRRAPSARRRGICTSRTFGTWRDAEGRLIWGVNDIDKACVQPYTLDLIRLTTSALLAIEASHFHLRVHDACDAVLDGYRSSLERGGRPIVLAERGRWLRAIALGDLRNRGAFWSRLEACPPAKGHVPRGALSAFWPRQARVGRVVRRVAGVGSLGSPRYVALGRWGDALIAREAKACVRRRARRPRRPARRRRDCSRARSGWAIRSSVCTMGGWCIDWRPTARASKCRTCPGSATNRSCCARWGGRRATCTPPPGVGACPRTSMSSPRAGWPARRATWRVRWSTTGGNGSVTPADAELTLP